MVRTAILTAAMVFVILATIQSFAASPLPATPKLLTVEEMQQLIGLDSGQFDAIKAGQMPPADPTQCWNHGWDAVLQKCNGNDHDERAMVP